MAFDSIEGAVSGLQRTYNSSSGCDIIATLDGIVIGNLNGISYSTTREKAPIYVMGSTDAVSFGRGKRGHAGSLVFTNFDRHALYDFMEGAYGGGISDKKRYYYWAKRTDVPAGGRSQLIGTTFNDLSALGVERRKPNYSDQIPPFTITLTSLNEYGNVSVMHIVGVEFINEGSGVSIDDIVTETQMTFVAREILGWRPLMEGAKISGDSYNITNTNILETINQLTAIKQAELFGKIANQG